MSDDKKCVCGRPEVEHGHLLSECRMFRPVEEAKPEPAPESVYERARRALDSVLNHWNIDDSSYREIRIALIEGEAAEKNYRWMVEHQADNKLEGYQELTSKLCASEERAEAAERTGRALVAEAEAERDTAVRSAEARARQAHQDRYDALSVASKDGLLSSEWILRTGRAERERDEARNEVERLEREHMNCGGAIVVLRRERDEASARGVELEAILARYGAE